MSGESVPAYIGTTPCGCMVAAIVDEGKGMGQYSAEEYRKEVAKTVAEWIADGLDVQRVTVGKVRKGPFGCDHKPPRLPLEDEEMLLTNTAV